MAKQKAQQADEGRADNLHWAETLAEEVIGKFPDLDEYVCAAGISPSGTVHFGNFRDVMTIVAVGAALRQRGKQVRLLFSWDDYDRYRKVPAGIDPKFEEHIGKPLSAVPDPHGDTGVTYAQRFERLFEGAMKELGIELDYRYQTELYQAGTYDDAIRRALKQREKIAGILFSLMSDKSKRAHDLNEDDFKRDYYPITVYSKFNGKDLTEVIDFDGETLAYQDKLTREAGTVKLGKDQNLKLKWKTDWPMRWQHEGVNFEPAGSDHLSPGSSYDAGSRIIREVFDGVPPVTARYGMVGLQGVAGKMSGSTGLAKSPNELLEVYVEPLLKWQYLKRQPKQNFSLAFDTEIFRQYDEFDREVAAHQKGELPRARSFAIKEAFDDGKTADDGDAIKTVKNPASFRQLVSFGQIVQWDEDKVLDLLKSIDAEYDESSVKERLPRARNWLVDHNPDQLIVLLEKPNTKYAKKLSDEAKANVAKLHKSLSAKGGESVEQLEKLVYTIPKDPKASDDKNKKAQRAFFKDVYQLLIGQDTGPRLSTFLWAVDRKRIRKLLEV
ncbi:MAG: lysine--tRNA ligase [bacterium]|nr:lysine--tRNA ligase [bacterium]MDZ4248421.1 lysine--tRNA ligase [Patescibacteria group bacterium]